MRFCSVRGMQRSGVRLDRDSLCIQLLEEVLGWRWEVLECPIDLVGGAFGDDCAKEEDDWWWVSYLLE